MTQIPMTNLELRRRMAGLSKLALAEKSGVHYVTLIQIEKKGQKPHHSTLAVLAMALGCEVDDLKGHVGAGAA